MTATPTPRFRRRLLLGTPVVVAAAIALPAAPAQASPRQSEPECVADLLRES